MASNPRIIHMRDFERPKYYLCNNAVGRGNPHKLTNTWTKVTCRNCLKYMTYAVEENINVDHPTHYNRGRIEVIDVIEDWDLDFHLGNVIKYIGRCKHKNSQREDLAKARWYIERKIKLLEEKDNG